MADKTLFTKIIDLEIPAKFVYQDELCIAIEDIDPKAPIHNLIIPRKPVAGIQAVEAGDEALLGHLLMVAHQLAEKHGLTANGFRVVINAGDQGGQSVPHLHLHLLGGRRMGWPPG
jgi:histidine triad (HIT) family protein